MKNLLFVILSMFSVSAIYAAESTEPLDSVYINLSDQESLQRGASTFINYCYGCHSAAYMRFNRLGRDLGISESNLKKYFVPADKKTGDLMTVAASEAEQKKWFGKAPPDLTLIARVRKPDWIYSYMRRFYADPESVNGWNNTLIQNAAMPHVLYRQQGSQRLSGHDEHGAPQFEIVSEGSMSAEEYDRTIRDLTNFLVYLGEPAKLQRYKVGGIVMLFLLVLFMLVYFLKKEYWRELH